MNASSVVIVKWFRDVQDDLFRGRIGYIRICRAPGVTGDRNIPARIVVINKKIPIRRVLRVKC